MSGGKMYYRVCDGLADKGKLVPIDFNLENYVHDNPNKDLYVSLFKYNENHKNKFNKDGTISGIKDVVTNHLILDFDSSDFEQVRKDGLSAISRLQKEFKIDPDSLSISYSGNKGIHIEAKLDKDFDETDYKQLVTTIGKDLPSFDPKINNASRIIRIPFTKHQSSGLYKTPITLEELKTSKLEDIKQISSTFYSPSISYNKICLPKLEKQNKPKKDDIPVVDLDFKKKPKWLSYWKFALQNGFFPEGTRSYALMVLASTYKSQGFNKTQTYHILKAAAELQAERFGIDKFSKDEIYRTIISQVFSDNWNGGTYAEDNFPEDLKKYLTDAGIPRKDEMLLEEVFRSPHDVFNSFMDFAENIDKNTLKTGIIPLDTIPDFRITTGMLVGLLGSPSSGKTHCAIEMLKTCSLENQQVAFFSMDMGSPLVLQRLAQKVSGKTGDELFKLFKERKIEEVEKIRQKILKEYANVHFSFKTAMTTEGIRKSLTSLQEKSGEKIRLVVVDYLECLTSSLSDPTAKISMISQELKDIATDFDTCVVLLLQPPKRVGDPSKEILSYTDIKGAATVAQACSVVISLWRDGFDPRNVENDNYISFAVIKNRMGKLAQIDCSWDGLTGKIGVLDDIERQQLEELRRNKQNQNNSSDEF